MPELRLLFRACPDAEYFVANLGSGSNNRYELLAPLQYQSATVKAGNGGAKIFGTNPSAEEFEPALYPDHDIFTGGAGDDILVGGPGDDILRAAPATTCSTVAVGKTSSTAKAATTKSSAGRAANASRSAAKGPTNLG